jgi:hypothetical protein
MLTKKILVSALIAAGTMGAVSLPLPGSAQSVEIYVNSPPPPPPVEVVPAPRSGYVWTPGYYEYSNNSYNWVGGKWEAERPGYVYRSSTWVERDGRWVFQSSRWEREER